MGQEDGEAGHGRAATDTEGRRSRTDFKNTERLTQLDEEHGGNREIHKADRNTSRLVASAAMHFKVRRRSERSETRPLERFAIGRRCTA